MRPITTPPPQSPAATDALLTQAGRSVCDEAQLFRVAVESMAQGLFMLDSSNRIIVMNQQFLDIYGLPAHIIKPGATARDIVEQSVLCGNYPGLSLDEAWQRASTRLAVRHLWQVQQRLGNGRVVAIRYAPIPHGGWVTTHLDVTDRQNAEDRLVYLAHHDALTGLANRLRLQEAMQVLIDEGVCFAVLALDLDGFKPVNDTFGHAAGDELLIHVARRLVSVSPAGASVARLGGDEFVVLYRIEASDPDSANPDPGNPDPADLAAALTRAIAQPFTLRAAQVCIGASVGVALAPQNGTSFEALMSQADIALYQVKSRRRGSFRLQAEHAAHDRAASRAVDRLSAFRQTRV